MGPWREKDLWARGITSWDAFPSDGTVVSKKTDGLARNRIDLARTALAARDLQTLANLVPPREHWRLYADFHQEAVFFDIETDGQEHQRPTVVSLFSAKDGLEVFLQGRNMDELPGALARHRLWVTFNGSCFDVPVLRNHFPELATPEMHLDLRFVLRRMGLSGGLKSLEDALGLARPPHLKGANGNDAVLLWRAYRARGDLGALRFLVEYNMYDAFQLRGLADRAYNRGLDLAAFDDARLTPFERGDVLYDVSKLLLELGLTTEDARVLERVRAAEF